MSALYARWWIPVWFVSALYPATPIVPETDQGEGLIQSIDRAEKERETNVAGYTVTEHYSIRNSHFDEQAQAIVETTYLRGQGKTYQVLSRNGPPFLQSRVMDRLLQEESMMSRGRDREQSLITTANYNMKLARADLIGDVKCEVIELTPRAKSAHLLKGLMWVDATTGAVIRVEGKPLASASFWAGRPEIVREYKVIDGFSLAQRSHALSQGLLVGRTEVTIDYSDYRITKEH